MVRVAGMILVGCLIWTVLHISPDSKAHPTAFLDRTPMGRAVQQEWFAAQAAVNDLQQSRVGDELHR